MVCNFYNIRTKKEFSTKKESGIDYNLVETQYIIPFLKSVF